MFISNVITAGYIKSFGVFYNEIVKEYPGTSEASAGLLMALLAGCRALMGQYMKIFLLQNYSRKLYIFKFNLPHVILLIYF